MILKNCSSGEIREAARRGGMRALADDGWRLVTEGITTPEEVLRVTKDQSISESPEQKLPQSVCVIRYEDMIADPAGALRTAADFCGLPMPQRPLPPVGDDRGCVGPYRALMAAALDQ